MTEILNQSWIIIVLIPVFIILYSFRILREYERGVVFLLGRFHKVKGPGLILVIPIIQQMVRVDLRIRVLDVPEQDVISRDNVSVKVNAVVYFRVIDAEKVNYSSRGLYERDQPTGTDDPAFGTGSARVGRNAFRTRTPQCRHSAVC